MNIKITALFLCLLLNTPLVFGQIDIITSEPIEVFHGAISYATYKGAKRTTPFEVLSAHGATVTVQIINPNYLLYQYSSVIKEIQIEDDMPDISDLVLGLNNLSIPLSM